MNMKKLLCMALAMLLTLGATALAESADLQAQLDAANARIAELEAQVELYKPYYESQIVAEYGEGGVIWLTDAQEEYEAASSAYAQYGLSIDDFAGEIKQEILETLVQNAILDDKAAELGLDQLDDEARASLEAEAAENFETYIETYKSYFAAEDATDEDAREQTIAALESYGLTQDTLLQQMQDSYVSEQLYNHVTADITVSDEDVKAAYDQMVSEDEANYADDRSYNSARNSGATIAWNPEGYRTVKHVLIKFDDEQATLYNNLQSTLKSLNEELEALDAPAEEADAEEATEAEAAEPEETEAPRSREEIQADIAAIASQTEALYSQLLPRAQQVIDEFEAGADFDSLIEKYNEDAGMQNEPTATNGYAVALDSTTWDPAFTEGAMSIEAIGQISAPVYGQNGIHIIYYLDDITPGPVPFEQIADTAREDALNEKMDDAYNAQIEAWVEEASPVYYADRF
ncbi:MAG: peptidylprolyl isomerase [Clostridia bacterium]|nr:peptidylprolyl isomerase [Clostridia bacterium]